MSGPERLVAGEATDFERELLGTWDRRQPSAQARARVLALAGAGLGAAAVLSAASATAAKAASTSIAPKAVIGWSAALVKWIAVGLVGATATAGAVAYVHHASLSQATTESAVANAAPASPTPARSAPVAPAAAEPPTTTIELGPNATPAVRAKAPSSTRSSTLDDEVSMIDQARRAIAQGDAAAALQVVGSYDAKYPGGALAQESTEIRIEALLAQGNRATAERLAAKFFASHPSSPYVHRIRALLGDTKGP